ncbi:MAG: peptidyl-prolyl cis-trans isomerase [Acidimicrobiia bacterium]
MTEGSSARRIVSRVVREPVVHFLLIGACLFGLMSWWTPDAEKSSRHIVVTQERLLEFMQYRNQTFSESARRRLGETLVSMTPTQKAALVDDYVREEVLYREALALDLDNTDYVIRRRLAQTMEYILRGTPEEDLSPPDDKALNQFFLTHLERYKSKERLSLRHLYFESATGARPAEARANAVLTALRTQAIGFNEALARSDRLAYFNEYVDETRLLIESHLGAEIANAAFEKMPSTSWQGPYRSRDGVHLIQVTRRAAPQTPEFESVKNLVLNDWRNAETEARLEKRIRGLIDTYRVESQVEPVARVAP